MNKLKVFHDTKGNTLTIWFGDSSEEYVAEEIGEDTVVMKNKNGKIIGMEKLNYQISKSRDHSSFPIEVITA